MLVSAPAGAAAADDRQPLRAPRRCRRRTRDEALAWLGGAGRRATPAALLAQAARRAAARARARRSGLPGGARARGSRRSPTPRALSPVALSARIDAAPRDERKAAPRRGDRLAAGVDRGPRRGRGRRGAASATSTSPTAIAGAGAARWRGFRCFAIIGRCCEQRALLAHPLQPRLVAEALLIDYRALFE